jgi:hypothetical protein
MLPLVELAFASIFNPRQPYRSTGVILLDLDECHDGQLDLFGASLQIEKIARLYQSVDRIKAKYGKHTLFLGVELLRPSHGAARRGAGDAAGAHTHPAQSRDPPQAAQYSHVDG